MVDPDYWVGQFKEVRGKYEQLTSELSYLLARLLEANEIKPILLEKRTKGIEEFRGKITRPDKSYADPLKDVTDLSGVRIILGNLTTVDTVCDLIAREFEVDQKRSERRNSRLDVDRFGYVSDHLIVKVNADRRRLTEWANLSDIWGEVQVRTALQHAWGSVSRKLDYQTPVDMPPELRRKLFRLSALFELADEEFDTIEKTRQELVDGYSEQLKAEVKDIAINVDSIKVYLKDSATVKFWTDYIESLGVTIGPIGMVSRDVKMAYMAGISTLTDLDRLLNTSKGWGEAFLREFYLTAHADAISQKRLSTDRNGVVTFFLIANHLGIFTEDRLKRELGWGDPHYVIEAARRSQPTNGDETEE